MTYPVNRTPDGSDVDAVSSYLNNEWPNPDLKLHPHPQRRSNLPQPLELDSCGQAGVTFGVKSNRRLEDIFLRYFEFAVPRCHFQQR